MSGEADSDGRTLWCEQDDPTDTGVDTDTDYLAVDSRDGSVTEAYADAEAATDGGQPLDYSADGNGTDDWKDEYVDEWPDGFARQSRARTTAWSEDPSDAWSRDRWKIHMGLSCYTLGERCDGCEYCEADDCLDDCDGDGCPVCREWCYNDAWEWVEGAEVDNREAARQAELDGFLDAFDVPSAVKERVRWMVEREDVSRYWNRWYSGQRGAAIGFMAVEIADSPEAAVDDERLQAVAAEVERPLEKIVEQGFERAESRGWT